MPRTFLEMFVRDGEPEIEVTVEYTYSGGCPAHYGSMNYPGHPAEPAEIEIVKAFTAASDVTLTAAEEERFIDWLHENHVEDEPDYDDWEGF